MLAGRAAEQLVFGDVTTGAESDLEQATSLARQMVGRWGMSEAIGAMSVLPDPRHGQASVFDSNGTSPATQELVDAEARRLLDECASEAFDVLTRERARLDTLVAALLRAETLDAGDIYRASGLPVPEAAGATPEQGVTGPA